MRLGLLVATALVPLVLCWALPLVSDGATPGHAGRVSHKLDRKRKALERNRDRDRVLTTDVSALHRRIGRLQRTIGTLRRRQRAFQADLDRKRAVLVRTQDDLRDQWARLARLRARLQTSRRILAARLIELYESDEPDIVTVILHSDGFAQLLENAEYLDRINEQDARVLAAVRDAKTDATATPTGSRCSSDANSRSRPPCSRAATRLPPPASRWPASARASPAPARPARTCLGACGRSGAG
jgi:septal ring factor EnvC (AmiA/AmiB activator)